MKHAYFVTDHSLPNNYSYKYSLSDTNYKNQESHFEFHIQNLCKKCSNLSGWILRTFTTRDSITMLTLFKSLVLPRLDYGSQLWSPHLVKHIDQLEKIQRSFTKHITGMQSLEYSERLVSLKVYSLQRRRGRYHLCWKIIEGLVPNFSKPIVCSYSERRGRSCIISHVNLGRLGSLAYKSFRWRATRLFNAMPKYIRCISYCSVVSFMSKFDCYLKNIVDLPGRPGFSNSLDSGDILQWWTPREDLASN